MLKLFLTAALVITMLAGSVLAASIGGYTKKDGTYVQPHLRTNPNSNPYDNYGFPGNYNPNTGRTTPGSQDTYLDRYNSPKPPSSSPWGR
jgi:opacity protein-like surface antigen